jgi:hypothetical protein
LIKSLVDGYAFDLEKQMFCYGGDALYAHQKEKTYMKTYAEKIQEAKKVRVVHLSSANWKAVCQYCNDVMT